MISNPKVLIIDDELDFVVALQAMLEAKSFAVTTACTRTQAQGLLKVERPDVLVLGTITPRGEAFRLHQWLKQNAKLRDVPILVLDAPLEQRVIRGWLMDEIRMLEAEDLIAKPVEPELLVARIERLLERLIKKIKVLVADDHTVVREGISAMLTLQKDIEVVGQARDGQEAVEKVRLLSPDVVVMDVIMPNMDGLEAAGQICRECPWVKVLILTQYDTGENVLTATRAGAYGFIPKSSAASQLVSGIRSVFGGDYYMVPMATRALVEEERRHSKN